MKILAVDIGGTYIKYAVSDENGNLSSHGSVITPKDSREALIEVLTELYSKVPNCDGIAVSMPGIIDTGAGLCKMGGALDYNTNFYIRDALYEKCPVKIVIENDAKCAAMAEASLGALKDVEDGIVIVLGTMIGGGIIHEHRLVRGRHFSAGEVSYMIPYSDRPLDRNNFWGNSCSVNALCRLYAEKKGCPAADANGRIIFDALAAGDEAAASALKEYSHNIAVQLFNLQTIYDPQLIAIGGGISAQNLLIESINQSLNELYDCCPYIVPHAQITQCCFGNNANLIGAAQVFVSHYDSEIS